LYYKKGFDMKYSASFRLWHWLNAIVVLGLLGTVFLRKTFLSWRTNSEILMTKLSEFGIDITTEQAKILAKAIRAGMWEWHIILGYALAFLVIYRIYLYFTNAKTKEKFSSLSLHKKAVEVLYYVLYATLFFMALSGVFLEFYKDLGFSKDFAHTVKEMHEFIFNFIMYFVILHIGGVVVAEIKDEKGIISNMISGDK
jgi:cytochrome b561